MRKRIWLIWLPAVFTRNLNTQRIRTARYVCHKALRHEKVAALTSRSTASHSYTGGSPAIPLGPLGSKSAAMTRRARLCSASRLPEGTQPINERVGRPTYALPSDTMLDGRVAELADAPDYLSPHARHLEKIIRFLRECGFESHLSYPPRTGRRSTKPSAGRYRRFLLVRLSHPANIAILQTS